MPLRNHMTTREDKFVMICGLIAFLSLLGFIFWERGIKCGNQEGTWVVTRISNLFVSDKKWCADRKKQTDQWNQYYTNAVKPICEKDGGVYREEDRRCVIDKKVYHYAGCIGEGCTPDKILSEYLTDKLNMTPEEFEKKREREFCELYGDRLARYLPVKCIKYFSK